MYPKRPKLTKTELAAALKRDYKLNESDCSLTNVRRGTDIKLRTGGVISTPYGSVAAATFLYIMLYGAHPKDDEYNRAERMKYTKWLLPPAVTTKPSKPKQTQPRVKLADKVNLLKAALLAQDNRITALETRLATLEDNLNQKD